MRSYSILWDSNQTVMMTICFGFHDRFSVHDNTSNLRLCASTTRYASIVRVLNCTPPAQVARLFAFFKSFFIPTRNNRRAEVTT